MTPVRAVWESTVPDEYKFTLTGWKALAAIAVFIGWYGIQMRYHVRPVDDAGHKAMQAWLLRGYRGETPRDILRKLEDARAGLPLEPEPPAMDIQIVSASAHGGTAHMIAKVGVAVNGGPPPDGQSIRYLSVCNNSDGTWTVLSESGAADHTRALWSVPYR